MNNDQSASSSNALVPYVELPNDTRLKERLEIVQGKAKGNIDGDITPEEIGNIQWRAKGLARTNGRLRDQNEELRGEVDDLQGEVNWLNNFTQGYREKADAFVEEGRQHFVDLNAYKAEVDRVNAHIFYLKGQIDELTRYCLLLQNANSQLTTDKNRLEGVLNCRENQTKEVARLRQEIATLQKQQENAIAALIKKHEAELKKQEGQKAEKDRKYEAISKLFDQTNRENTLLNIRLSKSNTQALEAANAEKTQDLEATRIREAESIAREADLQRQFDAMCTELEALKNRDIEKENEDLKARLSQAKNDRIRQEKVLEQYKKQNEDARTIIRKQIEEKTEKDKRIIDLEVVIKQLNKDLVHDRELLRARTDQMLEAQIKNTPMDIKEQIDIAHKAWEVRLMEAREEYAKEIARLKKQHEENLVVKDEQARECSINTLRTIFNALEEQHIIVNKSDFSGVTPFFQWVLKPGGYEIEADFKETDGLKKSIANIKKITGWSFEYNKADGTYSLKR